MAVIMECKKLTKQYGDQKVLCGVTLELSEGEKIGLVGHNGAGKSTIANIITGLIDYDDGTITVYKEPFSIGYLKQSTQYNTLDLQEVSDRLEKDIRFKKALNKLGLEWGDARGQKIGEERINTLSGGEKTKLELAKVLTQNHDLIILDEPTNHLDYQGIDWLIKQIKAYKGVALIISHDRYFLDQIISKTLELANGKITTYKGNYSWYREEKQRVFESQIKAYELQEKYKEQIHGQIKQLTTWSGKAHRESRKKAIETGNKFGGKEYHRAKAKAVDKQIKSRIKRLERIEFKGLQKPETEKSVTFSMGECMKSNHVLINAKDIRKSYHDKLLFDKSSFYIKRGEKVGVYGPNGCGKSTLMKAIMGEILLEGTLEVSSSIKIGYLCQDVLDLNKNLSVLQLFEVNSRAEQGVLRSQLYQIGFNEAMLSKRVDCLSLGEKMKLKLLLTLRQGCNLLLLDEPTNHIDLHVREQIESLLLNYEGTVLLVTHDRYMLEKIADRLLVFSDHKIKRFEYGLKEYLDKTSLRDKIKNQTEKERMILENKLAFILGKLTSGTLSEEEYQLLDAEYYRLMAIKKTYD